MRCGEAIFVDESTIDFPIYLLFCNTKFPIFPIFSILSFLFSYFFEQRCRWIPWGIYVYAVLTDLMSYALCDLTSIDISRNTQFSAVLKINLNFRIPLDFPLNSFPCWWFRCKILMTVEEIWKERSKPWKSSLLIIFCLNPGEYSTKFYTERLRPEIQRLTLLYTIFNRKGVALLGHVTDRNDR